MRDKGKTPLTGTAVAAAGVLVALSARAGGPGDCSHPLILAPPAWPVTAPPNQVVDQLGYRQAETSLIRVDQLTGQSWARSYVLAYNDDTDSVAPPMGPNFDDWSFVNRVSGSGYSTADSGFQWTYHNQLPLPAQPGVVALHGDPWLATWRSPIANQRSIVLYTSLGNSSLIAHQFNYAVVNSVVLARSTDAGQTFETPIIVAIDPSSEQDNRNKDGPKVAISAYGRALVAWEQEGLHAFAAVTGIQAWQQLNVGQRIVIDPLQMGQPPRASQSDYSRGYGDKDCLVGLRAVALRHPVIAAGFDFFYLASHVRYSSTYCEEKRRYEVYQIAYNNPNT